MKKSLPLLFVGATMALPAAAVENAELYGQVSKAVMVFDDSHATEAVFGDNDKTSTRFGVRASQMLNNGLTASVLLEVEIQSAPTNAVTQNVTPGRATTPANPAIGAGVAERHTRVGLAGDWGAFFVGRTSTATDGIAEIDIAGAADVMGSDVTRFGGGLQFRSPTGGFSGVRVANVFDNLDGLFRSRSDRLPTLRYDSPIWNGLQGRAAVAQGGDMDVAMLYDATHGDWQWRGGVGYAMNRSESSATTNAADDHLVGSVSVRHASGIAATLAGGRERLTNKTANRDTPVYGYAKLSYGWDAYELAVDYTKHDDMNLTTAADHNAQAVGVAAQYNMGHGASLAALYRHLTLDMAGTATDEIDVWVMALRVRF
jgi:predicted porin